MWKRGGCVEEGGLCGRGGGYVKEGGLCGRGGVM